MERVRLLNAVPRVRLTQDEPEPELKRTNKLTQKVIDEFSILIKQGLPFDGICDYIGLDPASFWRWKRAGERYLEAGEPAELAICGAFVLALRRALAEYRLTLSKRAHTAKDWYRNLAILERRDRKTYGRQDPQGGSEDSIDPDESFL